MTIDARVQRLVDIEEIKQLKARYWRCFDEKDWTGWRSTLADDFHFETFGLVRDGADAITTELSTVAAGALTIHQGHSAEIEITGPDTARAIWYFSDGSTHPAEGDQPPKGFRGHGLSHDTFVRTPDGWRIKETVVQRVRVDMLDGGLPRAADR